MYKHKPPILFSSKKKVFIESPKLGNPMNVSWTRRNEDEVYPTKKSQTNQVWSKAIQNFVHK